MASKEFETIVEGLSDALEFSRTIGMDSTPSYEQGGGRGALRDVDFYTRFGSLKLLCIALCSICLVTKGCCSITSKR